MTTDSDQGPDHEPAGENQPTIRINLSITIPPRVAWTLTGSVAGGGIVQMIHQVLLHR